MKGRKLTLEEVLNLEDGTKVWVEDSRVGFDNELCIYKKEEEISLYVMFNKTRYALDFIEIYDNALTFYEWIEDSEIVEIKSNVPICCSTCYKLSEEICNLRGLDLTDDNIRLIVGEFEEGK